MARLEKIVNYLSAGIVLFAGIVVISGYFSILEPTYRVGFGVIIIVYACVRLLMVYFSGRQEREKP